MENDILTNVWPEWHIVRQIGRGSFGIVYEAVRTDYSVESHAAIKVISIPQNESEIDSLRSEGLSNDASKEYLQGVVNDFVSEIRLMESFKGVQNIVSVQDYNVVEKTDEIGWDIYIRMELLTPLNSYISDKTLSEKDVIKLGVDICTALELCAKRNVIHRDIKPENIFINSFGDFKLGDFGIARKLENVTGGLSQKGTFNYMAPEIEKGTQYDATVDLYSLGLVLYRFMNKNRLPFLDTERQLLNPNERMAAIRRRIDGEPLPAPCEASSALAEVILCACSWDPGERFDTASAMKDALKRVANGTYSSNVDELDKDELDKTYLKYKYIPDTFNDEMIKLKFGSFERFTNAQILYKQGFEKILVSFLDIKELQTKIDTEIPMIEDSNANFYRKFSMLNDPYIYVRNNYHVEKLTDEEISVLENNAEKSEDFFWKTFEKVMYEGNEEDSFIFYGTPMLENACPSKAIVFEFAYDQVECTSVEHLVKIEKKIKKWQTTISNKMKVHNIPCSFVVYNGIPKTYSLDDTARNNKGIVVANDILNSDELDKTKKGRRVEQTQEPNKTTRVHKPPQPEPPMPVDRSKVPAIIAAVAVFLLLIGGGIFAYLGLFGNGDISRTSETAEQDGAEQQGREEIDNETDPQDAEEEANEPEPAKEMLPFPIRESFTISAGGLHTVALKSDGTVVAVGQIEIGRGDVGEWTDIVAVSAGGYHTVGLKSNGTVVAVGLNFDGQCGVGQWTDIVAVSAGSDHTVALKSDGTVVAVGGNNNGQCDVGNWTNIVAISAGSLHTIGLKSDGTVVAVGENYNGQCDVENWTDIVTVSAGAYHTIGLKSDGTVLSVGINSNGQCDVDNWTDIVAVSAGNNHTVGLKSDGSVVAVGHNNYGQCGVDGWTDIVAVSAGSLHTIGLKSDGTLVAIGSNESNECNVSSWIDIRVPAENALKLYGTEQQDGDEANNGTEPTETVLDRENSTISSGNPYNDPTVRIESLTGKSFTIPSGFTTVSSNSDVSAVKYEFYNEQLDMTICITERPNMNVADPTEKIRADYNYYLSEFGEDIYTSIKSSYFVISGNSRGKDTIYYFAEKMSEQNDQDGYLLVELWFEYPKGNDGDANRTQCDEILTDIVYNYIY